MIEIRRLEEEDIAQLTQVVSGYRSNSKYEVAKTETDDEAAFTLRLVTLETPRVGHFDHLDEETLQRYSQVLQYGFSLAAYDGEQLVGIAVAEPRAWNNSLWVWEFHVKESHRGRGLGRRLMDELAAKASAAGLRIIVCETQNTNVPAIRFYRKVGFAIEGVDASYYTNEDMRPDGTVAIFMKRRLT